MRMEDRRARLGRGVSAACFAAFAALASHVLAGGAVPGPGAMVFILVLSAFVCVLLAGRTSSLWRLTVSVGISQTMFHWMFSVTAGRTYRDGREASDSGSSALDAHLVMHGAHSGGMQHTMPEATNVAMRHDSVGMMFSHVLAAVLTIAVFHYAERWLAAVSALLALMWTVVVPLLAIPVLVPVLRRRPVPVETRVPARTSAVLSPMRRRGPPLSMI